MKKFIVLMSVLFAVGCSKNTENATQIVTRTQPQWVLVGSLRAFTNTFFVQGSTLFAGTSSGAYRSLDNGVSWAAANTGFPANPNVSAFAANGNFLFAGNGSVYRSTDNGASWTAAFTGISDSVFYVSAFAVSGNNTFVAFKYSNSGSSGGGIYHSIDNGTSWTAVNTGLPDYPTVSALAVQGNNIFAGTRSGVYRSLDNGAFWDSVNVGLPNNPDVTALIAKGNILFAGINQTDRNVYRSSDNGTIWTPTALVGRGGTGFADGTITLVVSGDSLFAGDPYIGVLCSGDNGVSWKFAGSGLDGTIYRALCITDRYLFTTDYFSHVWRLPLLDNE
jgi:photosystem II stability/assembly factor-like uncharacterized protein